MGKSLPSHPKHAAFVHLRPRIWNSEPIRAITMIFRRCGLLRAMRKQTHRHPQVISWVQDGTTVSLRSVVPYQHTYQHTHTKKKKRKKMPHWQFYAWQRPREDDSTCSLAAYAPFFFELHTQWGQKHIHRKHSGMLFFFCFVRNKRFLLLLMR